MAQALGLAWKNAGHGVTFGSRSPSVRSAGDVGVPVKAHRDAIRGSEVVVLALPYRAVEGTARALANELTGKLVVDISNPFDALPDNRVSGAEITARALGPGARVIAAFKDNFAITLGRPRDEHGRQRDVHYAGDDETAKRTFARLVTDMGFTPVDCGPLRNARVLDAMVPLMIELDGRYQGKGQSSWKFLA